MWFFLYCVDRLTIYRKNTKNSIDSISFLEIAIKQAFNRKTRKESSRGGARLFAAPSVLHRDLARHHSATSPARGKGAAAYALTMAETFAI
jgi:hypothetical protein